MREQIAVVCKNGNRLRNEGCGRSIPELGSAMCLTGQVVAGVWGLLLGAALLTHQNFSIVQKLVPRTTSSMHALNPNCLRSSKRPETSSQVWSSENKLNVRLDSCATRGFADAKMTVRSGSKSDKGFQNRPLCAAVREFNSPAS